MTKSQERSLWKGLLAGAIAGLVATAAKTAAERFGPQHRERADSASAEMHWGVGIAAGAAYGAVAEFFPAATAKEGAAFGLTLMSVTQRGVLPALGMAPAAEDETLGEETAEAATHIVYGVVAEKVRGIVRPLL
ncbi:DUF1440 domain-containing protein [Granulicella cerasi]|uniref:DUF1440 domain-containing protein n=1 Tax=Granulicella cerasi TaxID=741063 RepID=A0ABW1ZAT2_9BACT|nr:DUF1440 domain-containing protein [Granulicella cerasi]